MPGKEVKRGWSGVKEGGGVGGVRGAFVTR